MKKLLIRLLYRLLFMLDSATFNYTPIPSDTIGLRHKIVGAHPTLRHLPLRLSTEFEHIEDPYIHRILSYLNEAITELYVINTKLHSAELDRLLSRRFYL
jgi:hypothetical protein